MSCWETQMGLSAFTDLARKGRILVVDDEPGIRATLSGILQLRGFQVETASCAREALQMLNANVFDLVITDLRMESELAGYDVIQSARQQKYRPAVVILSAFPSSIDEYDVHAIFAKGNNVAELLQTVDDLLNGSAGNSSD